MFVYNFPLWNRIIWLVVIGLAFALEFLGIFRPGEATLTALIKATIPTAFRAMIVGWLAYHFVIQP
jgi:hypothetical protein